MWEDYIHRVPPGTPRCPVSTAIERCRICRRYRVVLIDESHNLRNREGKRYKVIQEYIEKNDSKCILLSATPYNKTYLDLSIQLQLFRRRKIKTSASDPNGCLKESAKRNSSGGTSAPFARWPRLRRASTRTTGANLMRLYMVRRTRSFIKDNYAKTDPANGRRYLTFDRRRTVLFP